MFNGGNTQNNNSNDRSINTRIKSFFGETASLQLAYWNDNISIKINPLVQVKEDGSRQYDYNRRISTALTPEKCLALKKAIEKTIMPAIKNVAEGGKLEKALNVGVQVGQKGTALYIEYKDDDKGVPTVYMTLFMNMADDKKAVVGNVFTYKFNKTVVNEDYNAETGESKESIIEAEFEFVVDKISKISDVSGTIPHAINSDNAYKTSSSGKSSGGSYTSGGNENRGGYSAPVSDFSAEDFSFVD